MGMEQVCNAPRHLKNENVLNADREILISRTNSFVCLALTFLAGSSIYRFKELTLCSVHSFYFEN